MVHSWSRLLRAHYFLPKILYLSHFIVLRTAKAILQNMYWSVNWEKYLLFFCSMQQSTLNLCCKSLIISLNKVEQHSTHILLILYMFPCYVIVLSEISQIIVMQVQKIKFQLELRAVEKLVFLREFFLIISQSRLLNRDYITFNSNRAGSNLVN